MAPSRVIAAMRVVFLQALRGFSEPCRSRLPLPLGRPGSQVRHGGVKAALLHEYQASGVEEAGSQPPPQAPHFFVAFSWAIFDFF